ncbi:DNA polymerase III subunit gamma/tau [Treponema sp. OMZ 840]|uniref:DNA polymerase III subunit gamma/tau n=1 Tax=Treponema sp. OMZ 840 TaxID=244313 RepID=UPI003D8C5527
MAYEANTSYEVTAARRRPRRFEELVGQDFVTATLKNAIESGQTAHAYLFSGPRGCGKTSAARILAKMLNCGAEKGNAPCGECSACVEIAKGASMDVIEIDGASNTSVNDVRQIKDEVLFPPNSLKYKIYIIDEVHMLSTSAFNALLKTIEEPPPYVIFIFATTELHKVPATIKSRCQQFHFRLGSVEQIKTLLADAAREAGIQADDEALYWIARESTGSFRDAYTLFDQVAAFSEGNITYEKIRDKLGLVGIDRLNKLCAFCAAQNTGEALLFVDELLQSGTSIEQCVSNISDYLRSLLFIKTGITKEALLGQAADRYEKQVVDAWSSAQLEKAIALFLQLYRDIRYSLNPRYELELAVERLCTLSSRISRAEIKQAVDMAAHLLSGGAYPQKNGVQGIQSSVALQGGVQTNGFPHERQNAEAPNAPVQFPKIQFSQTAPPHTVSGTLAENAPVGGRADKESFCDADSAEGAYKKTAIPDVPRSENRFQQGASGEPVRSEPVQNESGKAQNASELKEKTIKAVAVSKVALSAALSRTGEWLVKEHMLHIPVQTAFEQIQIQNELQFLAQTVSGFWSQTLQCCVEIAIPPENQSGQEEIPEQVQMICDVFQGEIKKAEIKQPDIEIRDE